MIQGEADLQYMNEAQENTNQEFADEMEDYKEHMKNDVEIQGYVYNTRDLKGYPLINIQPGKYGKVIRAPIVSTFKYLYFKIMYSVF